MTRRIRRRVGRLLVLATVLQWLWALPAAITAELRAIECCERHCDHEPTDPVGCCNVAPAVADGASLREAASAVAPVAVVLPTIRVAVVHASLESAPPDPIPPRPPAPAWILTHSLRL